jgi:hypothetical protein
LLHALDSPAAPAATHIFKLLKIYFRTVNGLAVRV